MTTTHIPAGFRCLPLPLAQLSLSATLKCGQSFRWTSYSVCDPSSDASLAYEYRFCLRDRLVCLRQSSDTLFYRSIFPDDLIDPTRASALEDETLAWLRDYFQLDVDLVTLYDEWSNRDIVFRNVQARFPGLRVLRQDPWENLVSFICSSNNNITRITKMVQDLGKHFSPPLLSLEPPNSDSNGTAGVSSYHPLPPPSALAAPDVATKLRSLGFGYRADYIQRTAKLLVENHGTATTNSSAHCVVEAPEKWLMTLRDLDTLNAREELLKFVGVGRKVADCILLMSLDKREVVPVDTHVHQIAMKYYGFSSRGSKKVSMTPKLYDEISTKLADTWGAYAGWAHNVVFTADLKIFSSYGMPNSAGITSSSTPITTPASQPSSNKRLRKTSLEPPEKDELPVITASPSLGDVTHLIRDTTLAERVKRRRRGV